MPRKEVIEKLIYKFDELDERAKDRARDWFREGALDYEWWDAVYEDAKNSGLKIIGFDLGRSSEVEGEFIRSAEETAELIIKDHGKDTETYKDAAQFLADLSEDQILAEKDGEDYDDSEAREELEKEFLKTLCEDYRIILEKEMDYLTSDEAVDESIMANEYEFNEDGSRA